MIDLIVYGLIVVTALGITLALFLGILWVGFRMGRKTIGQPEPPIIHQKPVRLVEEDPFFRPMTGRDQPNVPTIPKAREGR